MHSATFFALGAALAGLAVVAGWRGARPPDLSRPPRMIPWRFIMLLSAAAAIVLLAQAARLSGFDLPQR